jgi:hypothetical protein
MADSLRGNQAATDQPPLDFYIRATGDTFGKNGANRFDAKAIRIR